MRRAARLAAWLLNRRPWPTLLLVFIVLLFGFAAAATPPFQWLFGRIAEGIAVAAAFLLRLSGFGLVRTGIELRDLVTGHAIAVTSACDGHGLLIAALALWTWLRARTLSHQGWPKAVAVALALVLLFNLARIVGLFLALGHRLPMSLQHLYITPLASVPLVAGVALYARRLSPRDLVRRPLVWLILAVAAAAAWYFVQAEAGCAVAAPLANALLRLNPGPLIEGISCSDGEARIATSALVSQAPPTHMAVPFAPSDFLLPTPLIIASLATAALSGRARTGRLLALAAGAFLLMILAMALGAWTTVHDQAQAANLRYLGGRTFFEPYLAPPPALLATFKAVQNALVHFNLFVLPFALFAWAGGADVPQPATATLRQRRQRRRRLR